MMEMVTRCCQVVTRCCQVVTRLWRPVVLGDVDLEALPGGVVLVAVDAGEGPVVDVQLVLAALHVRLQVSLGR